MPRRTRSSLASALPAASAPTGYSPATSPDPSSGASTRVPRRAPEPRRLLAALECAGVPFALVSASPRTVVDSVVAGSLADVAFAFTLSADDTVRTKPHPDPYRAAAERLGVATGACVAVEDSPDGTPSAEAAGCPVLVVPSLLPVAPGEGRHFADSLEDVDLAVLEGVLTGAPTGVLTGVPTGVPDA